MDSWSILPVVFDKYLIDNSFYDAGNFLFSGEALPLPLNSITFRDRFTAAFLRYLKQTSRSPVEAMEPLGRSWRQFQRYLVGGDQTPKMGVVVALAAASGVPVEWIIGTSSRIVKELASALADVEIIVFHCAQSQQPAAFEELGLKARLPASILYSVRLEPHSARLVVVHGADTTTPFGDGDMLLLDVSDDGKAVLPEGGVYLLKSADAAYLQKIVPTANGICLSGEGEHSGIQWDISDSNAIEIIGHVVWIGRTL